MKSFVSLILLIMMACIGMEFPPKAKSSGQEPSGAVGIGVIYSSCVTTANPCCSPDGMCGKEFTSWCIKDVPVCPKDHKPVKGECRQPLQNRCPSSTIRAPTEIQAD